MKKILTLATIISNSFGLFAQVELARHEFQAEHIKKIVVDGEFCNVTVTPGQKVTFFGLITGSGNKGDYTIQSSLKGATLEITVEKAFSKKSSQLSTAKFEIQAPKSVQLEISNSSGNIQVRGASAKFHEFKATSGNIFLEEIEGDVVVATTSGNIVLDEIVGNVQVKSTSGEQEIAGILGKIESRATSGNIRFNQIEGDLICTATSGNVVLRETEGTIMVKTTSGNISGKDVRIADDSHFTASSGNIVIDTPQEESELSFDLSSGSGNLSVNDYRTQKNLSLNRGYIQIHGNTTSGNQQFRTD